MSGPRAPHAPKKTPPRKRGRRPKGRGDTRRDILRAAVDVFAREGYDHATVRAISAAAHVDPALVFHYFRGKDRLFVEAMRTKMEPPEPSVFPVPANLEEAGVQVVGLFLERWGGGDGSTPFLGLLRSAASNPRAAALLRTLFKETITPFVSEALGPEDVELRVGLVGSQLLGIGTMRYVLQVEPLASMPSEEVARLVGPTVGRYLRVSRAAEGREDGT